MRLFAEPYKPLHILNVYKPPGEGFCSIVEICEELDIFPIPDGATHVAVSQIIT